MKDRSGQKIITLLDIEDIRYKIETYTITNPVTRGGKVVYGGGSNRIEKSRKTLQIKVNGECQDVREEQ